jgi:ABC-2 type transport system ATP-binding protein
MKLVEIQNISKSFVNHCALNDISMDINEGTVFGLLGPNGAGKTTLIRILNQITLPDKGQILFQGHLLSRGDIEKVGYLPEERGLYRRAAAGEQVCYLARLKGMTKTDAEALAREWFERLGVAEWWNRPVGKLSKGMQQKVQFIATVVHRPRLLVLDEPFSGFDADNSLMLKQQLMRLKASGTGILFSTHNLQAASEMCDKTVQL